MTDLEIQKDRSTRADACKVEIENVLAKYEFSMTAEDNWTPNTKIKVDISFVDLKKYATADLAQEDKPIVPVPTSPDQGQALAEGVQPDGSVVINKEALN